MQQLVINVALHTTIVINKRNHNIYTYILSGCVASISIMKPPHHIILTLSKQSLPYPNYAKHLARG